MRDYIIMTDSCCEPEPAGGRRARALPFCRFPLRWRARPISTRPTMPRCPPEDLFRRRSLTGENSTTAAANVGQFNEAMRRALDAGKDILCICFSERTVHHLPVRPHRGGGPEKRSTPTRRSSSSTPSPPRRGQGMLHLPHGTASAARSSPDIETLAAYREEHPSRPNATGSSWTISTTSSAAAA